MIPRIRRPKGLIGRTEASDRPLKLVVDERSLSDGPALAELLRFDGHPEVELWATGPSLPRRFLVGAYRRPDDSVSFRYDESGTWGVGSVQNTGHYLADVRGLLESGFPAAHRVLEEHLCLFAAAEAFGADAIVTGAPLLHLRDWALKAFQGMSILTITEGLGIIGLKLRTRREFWVPYGSGGRLIMDRGSFYWTVIRDALPAGWRWHGAAVRCGRSSLSRLTGSTFTRFAHALRGRDACQEQLQLRQEPDLHEVLYHLDALLCSLAGAFDSAAHVANQVYAVHGRHNRIGWRKPQWREALKKKAERLAAEVEEGSNGEAILDCLYGLRNLIHEEVLGRSTRGAGKSREDLLTVPPLQRKEGRWLAAILAESADRLGGRDRWGIRLENDCRGFIEPDRYLEELFANCLVLLDQLMGHTEVAHLLPPGTILASERAPRGWQFNEPIHESLRLLGSLGPPPATLVSFSV
jgi:hypothetical protein